MELKELVTQAIKVYCIYKTTNPLLESIKSADESTLHETILKLPITPEHDDLTKNLVEVLTTAAKVKDPSYLTVTAQHEISQIQERGLKIVAQLASKAWLSLFSSVDAALKIEYEKLISLANIFIHNIAEKPAEATLTTEIVALEDFLQDEAKATAPAKSADIPQQNLLLEKALVKIKELEEKLCKATQAQNNPELDEEIINLLKHEKNFENSYENIKYISEDFKDWDIELKNEINIIHNKLSGIVSLSLVTQTESEKKIALPDKSFKEQIDSFTTRIRLKLIKQGRVSLQVVQPPEMQFCSKASQFLNSIISSKLIEIANTVTPYGLEKYKAGLEHTRAQPLYNLPFLSKQIPRFGMR